MKQLIVALVILFAHSSIFAQSFEGVLYATYTSKAQSADIAWYFQQNRMALEMELQLSDDTHNRKFVADQKQEILHILTQSSEGKFYQKQKLSVAVPGVIPTTTAAIPNYIVRDNKISVETQEYTITFQLDYDTSIDPSQYLFLQSFSDPGLNAALQYAQSHTRKGQAGFPSHSIVKDKAGNVISEFSVTGKDKRTVPEKIFAIPDDYIELE